MRFQAVIRSRPRSTWIVAIAALALAAPAAAGDVGPAPIDALRAATVQGLERSQVRGAGIGLDRSVEPTTWWHWGSNPGFQSLVVLEPERGDAIVVLTNTGGGLDNLIGNLGGYNLSKEIARQALGIRGTWDLRRDATE